jgi:hypothetical protein
LDRRRDPQTTKATRQETATELLLQFKPSLGIKLTVGRKLKTIFVMTYVDGRVRYTKLGHWQDSEECDPDAKILNAERAEEPCREFLKRKIQLKLNSKQLYWKRATPGITPLWRANTTAQPRLAATLTR